MMLALFNHTLEDLLFHEIRLAPEQVEIRFESPTGIWSTSQTKPVISLFLFDVKENIDKRFTAIETSRRNGKAEHRMPARRMDLSYMVSVLASDPQDEAELLWRVTAILMKYSEFPKDILPEELRNLEPPITAGLHYKESGRDLLDLWEALDSPPRPCLYYVVTVPLDLELASSEPISLVRSREFRYGLREQVNGLYRFDGKSVGLHLGGVLRDHNYMPLSDFTIRHIKVIGAKEQIAQVIQTDRYGKFVLPYVEEGTATLEILWEEAVLVRVALQVPSDSYDIVIDSAAALAGASTESGKK